LHIQYSHLDAFLSEQMHNNLANAVTSSCNNYHLLTPYISVVGPIVRHSIIEPLADPVRKSKYQQRLQMPPCRGMVGSGTTTIKGVFTKEE
jgi:hypothetical protein